MSGSLRKRRKIEAALKAKVALAAIRNDQTIAQISSTHQVHASQIFQWKKQALAGLTNIFSNGDNSCDNGSDSKLASTLYEEIGRLKVELDWLKKRL